MLPFLQISSINLEFNLGKAGYESISIVKPKLTRWNHQYEAEIIRERYELR